LSRDSKSFDAKSFYENEGLEANRYASPYFWERRYHQKKASLVKVILKNALRQGDIFLDAGCGSGELSLVAKNLGGNVISLDLSKSYLNRVSKSIGTRLCASVSSLPFKSRSIDIVVCADVIEHVDDYEKVLSELSRVFGRLIIITTPCEGIIRRVYKWFFPKKLRQIDESVGHLHIFPVKHFKFFQRNLRVKSRSYHVIQPLADKIIPKKMVCVVDKLEKIADILLPYQGTISFIIVTRDQF
jgi:ubiquinone/menaquinone biosynthesis C-methylase UbiE